MLHVLLLRVLLQLGAMAVARGQEIKDVMVGARLEGLGPGAAVRVQRRLLEEENNGRCQNFRFFHSARITSLLPKLDGQELCVDTSYQNYTRYAIAVHNYMYLAPGYLMDYA